MTTAPTQNIRGFLQQNEDLIPAMPATVVRALELIKDPEAETTDFEVLLEQDPAIAVNVLRLATSPLYGFANQRATIRDAIVRIGRRGLRGVLLCCSLRVFQGAQYACYGKEATTLWRHAVAVAAAARAIGKRLQPGLVDPEELFIGGLLHDLGKLLLAPVLTKRGIVIAGAREPAHVLEARAVQMDHQEAGDIVAAKWELSPLLRAIIVDHHRAEGAGEFPVETAVVRLADRVATDHGFDAGSVDNSAAWIAADLAAIGMTAKQWQAGLPELVETMSSAI